mmetsp:Transcript_22286/g.45531  ORF Transcript_22286/g.45531 Transcript_22286/m.45531 type:complete len:207 (+) Transcript_22286:130-750(+)
MQITATMPHIMHTNPRRASTAASSVLMCWLCSSIVCLSPATITSAVQEGCANVSSPPAANTIFASEKLVGSKSVETTLWVGAGSRTVTGTPGVSANRAASMSWHRCNGIDSAGRSNGSSVGRFVRMTADFKLSVQGTGRACCPLSMRPARSCKPALVCPPTYSKRWAPEDASFLIANCCPRSTEPLDRASEMDASTANGADRPMLI